MTPGLRDVERRTIQSLNREHVKRMLPFVGASGADSERLLLFDEWQRVEHEPTFATALAEFETNEERKEFLRRVARRYGQLYEQVGTLLRQKYFCAPERK